MSQSTEHSSQFDKNSHIIQDTDNELSISHKTKIEEDRIQSNPKNITKEEFIDQYKILSPTRVLDCYSAFW
jgi:hypothetical protein